MFASGYVPGSITSLLQSTSAKKKTKVKKEKAPVEDEEKSAALSELFSMSAQATENNTTNIGKKKKKRKLSESTKSDEETKVEESPASSEKSKHPKRRKKSDFVDDVERRKRTVFVGNVPNSSEKKALKRLFKQFGDIETVRFRSVTTSDPKAPKKKAIVTGEFHPRRSSMNAYIVFKEADSAKAALAQNGQEFNQHHLRVDLAFSAKQHDQSRCVFVGSLPYDAEDEELREHFADCGSIDNVRIIRDKASGMGKGFGYIKFQEKSSVEFALKLDGEKFKGRRLRIQLSKTQNPINKQEQKGGTPQKTGKGGTLQKTGKAPTRASNATQGSFGGEKADSMKRLKEKKQKKIKKQREMRQQKKMAKVLSGGDSKKDLGNKDQPKKAFKKLNKKVQVRNRLAKKKKKTEKK